MTKTEYIQQLAKKVVDLQDGLHFRDKVYATKIKAVTTL